MHLDLVTLVVDDYDRAIHVDDFAASHRRMINAGVTFVGVPRSEPYGQVAVFVDVAGNNWDLLGPPSPS